MKKSTQFCSHPHLPDHLEKMLDEPFSQFASLQIDRWLWYIEQEFEGVQR